MFEASIMLAGLALILGLLWLHGLPKPRAEAHAFRAGCQWGEGDYCTNPKSPMAGQAREPVCIRWVRCKMRQVVCWW